VLLQQFSAMQKQLFEHTQQMLTTMAATINAAHTQQLVLIRDELLRVHEVNRELEDLNREQALRRQAPPEAAGSAVPAPPLAVPRSGVGSPRSSELSPPIAGPGRRDISAIDSPAAAPAAPAGEQVQALLDERINNLENERSRRWEKMLQMLTPADTGPVG
jgi:hypothetical protein